MGQQHQHFKVLLPWVCFCVATVDFVMRVACAGLRSTEFHRVSIESLRNGKGGRDDFVVIPSAIEACCTSYVSNHVTQVPEFLMDE